MDKKFLTILSVVVIALIGVWFIAGNGKEQVPSSQAQPSSHIFGNDNLPILIEFGDFQCPACYAYEPVLRQIRIEYADKIAFQFRHYPLTQIHKNAYAAHRAAEASHRQGKFWEMHDLLYDTQKSWSQSSDVIQFFDTLAMQLNLDIERFKSDFVSLEIAGIINADIKEGQKVGATSTPTFVINGRVLTDIAPDYETFKKVLDNELAKN